MRISRCAVLVDPASRHQDLITSLELKVEGSALDPVRFISLLDRPAPTFPVATARN